MRATWIRAALGTLLLAAFGGCERPAEQASVPVAGPSFSQSASDYVLIEGTVPSSLLELEVSEIIGSGGGSLALGGHAIEVPAGAVDEPTLFTMTLLTSGYVEVELSAVVDGLLGGVLDVGAEGFGDETVALTMTYDWATNVDDPGDLLILRMRDDGTVEPLPVVLDREARTITARLEHFSRYCMASN